MKKIFKIILNIYNHPLNSNYKFRSIFKFIRWQLATRIFNKKILIDWVDNSKFLCSRGETGLTGNIYFGLSEYIDMLFLLHVLKIDDLFIDVGANVGAYTILASGVVGSNSMAFEPIKETAKRLEMQCQLNGIQDKVSILVNGVGAINEVLEFSCSNDTINKVAISGDSELTESVDVVKLDDVVTYDGNMLIKIDVEGFESNVIDGAKELLSNSKVYAVIIELNDSGEIYGHSNQEVHKKLTLLGFNPILYNPFGKKFKITGDYLKNRMNTIYIRDSKFIQNRLLSSPNHIIHTANGFKI